MRKFIKYSLFGFIYLIIIYFLAIMFIVTAKADIVKPNDEIEPFQVVKIQLRGLMKNDDPSLNMELNKLGSLRTLQIKNIQAPFPNLLICLKVKDIKCC